MSSIRQQLYERVAQDTVMQALGFTWYGSENGTASDLPPPGAPAVPFGYLRLVGEVVAGRADVRTVVQWRLHDHERWQYTRINAAIRRLAVLLPSRPDFTLTDPATLEVWWFPQLAGIGAETEDPDRPHMVLRVVEWAFRKVLGGAVVAAGS